MKPLRIFSHVAIEHPGYLYEYLDGRNIPYEKVYIAQGEAIPQQLDDVSGLVFLGAPVSISDPLSWISDELELIKSAILNDVPVLGICFGGQLICKALGGEVCTNNTMQIGWHLLTLTKHAKELFGLPEHFYAFEWHGDSFNHPEGVIPLFKGDCFENQGFLHQRNLALQFHPEITGSMIHEWIERYSHCLDHDSVCIQDKDQIIADLDECLAQQRMVADKLFDWWIDQVKDY